MALENTFNNFDGALDFLQKLQEDGKYDGILSGKFNHQFLINKIYLTDQFIPEDINSSAGPSSSHQTSSLSSPLAATIAQTKTLLEQKRSEKEAFDRFREGYNSDDDDYLDLPLTHEETLILEYKGALNMM